MPTDLLLSLLQEIGGETASINRVWRPPEWRQFRVSSFEFGIVFPRSGCWADADLETPKLEISFR